MHFVWTFIMGLYWCSPSIPAPMEAPSGVMVQLESNKSGAITVRWSPVSRESVRGHLLGYKVQKHINLSHVSVIQLSIFTAHFYLSRSIWEERVPEVTSTDGLKSIRLCRWAVNVTETKTREWWRFMEIKWRRLWAACTSTPTILWQWRRLTAKARGRIQSRTTSARRKEVRKKGIFIWNSHLTI